MPMSSPMMKTMLGFDSAASAKCEVIVITNMANTDVSKDLLAFISISKFLAHTQRDLQETVSFQFLSAEAMHTSSN